MINIKQIINHEYCPIHKKCSKYDGYCYHSIRVYLNYLAWYENEWVYVKKILNNYLNTDITSVIKTYLTDTANHV